MEVYISTDVETDGPIPGPHSLLSFASAAYTVEKGLIATYGANLDTLPGATGHKDTMAWWATRNDAWIVARSHLRAPQDVMPEYVKWITSLPGKPVFVGYPAGFDFLFIYWYLIKFTGDSPFSFSALDIKTYAMSMMKKGYRDSTKRNMPRRWFSDRPHTHLAADDAIEQGELFMSMLAENTGAKRIIAQKHECHLELIKESVGYSALCLNLPGACGQGDTKNEAIDDALLSFREVVLVHRTEGSPVPWAEPSKEPDCSRIIEI